jgi:hypothetical protein
MRVTAALPNVLLGYLVSCMLGQLVSCLLSLYG